MIYVDGGRFFGPVVILGIPVPDTTMPYNVLLIVGTLLVLLFGKLFQYIYREDITEASSQESLKARLTRRLLSMLPARRSAVKEKKE